jgi:lysophospholipase L1-like esterase
MRGLNPSYRQAFTAASLVISGVAHASQHAQHRTILKRADDNWPIKTGYVAFGDSFGAGMGTGTTSGDACRVGSNNFGDLLYKWTNNDQVDFQRKVCSGDTTVGLNRQIDEWNNPRKADVATISTGGNDLGFSDMVWYCVLTPNTAELPPTTRQKCTEAKDKAKRLMEDTGDDGLRNKLKKAYKRVLDKSGRDVSIPTLCYL